MGKAIINHAEEKRIVSLVATSIALVGPFDFILTLLFRPRGLTPYLADVPLVLSLEGQTLLTVAIALISCLISGTIVRSRSLVLEVLTEIAPAILAFSLIVFTRNMVVPTIAACLLAFTCPIQMRCLLARRPLDRSEGLADCALSAAISLGIASLLFHLGYSLGQTTAEGTLVLCAVMCVSGILSVALPQTISDTENEKGGAVNKATLTSPTNKTHAADVEHKADAVNGVDAVGTIKAYEPQSQDNLKRQWKVMWRSTAPLLPACVICSLSLGLSWREDVFEKPIDNTWPYLIALIITVVFLAILALIWKRNGEVQDEPIAPLVVIPCAFGLIASLAMSFLSINASYIILTASNMLFLSLMWIEMLYLARRHLLKSSTLPLLYVPLLLGIFGIGTLIVSIFPEGVDKLIVPLLLVAYVVFLIIYVSKRQSGSTLERQTVLQLTKNTPLTYKEICENAYEQMAEDFKLSPKETELLPWVVKGLSARSIGKRVFLSHETVKTHKYHIYQKAGVHDYEELVEIFENYASMPAENAS